jgi:hypothetical protein
MNTTRYALSLALLLAAAPAFAEHETLTGTVERADGLLVIQTDDGDQVELKVDGAAEHVGGLLGDRYTVSGPVKPREEEGLVMKVMRFTALQPKRPFAKVSGQRVEWRGVRASLHQTLGGPDALVFAHQGRSYPAARVANSLANLIRASVEENADPQTYALRGWVMETTESEGYANMLQAAPSTPIQRLQIVQVEATNGGAPIWINGADGGTVQTLVKGKVVDVPAQQITVGEPFESGSGSLIAGLTSEAGDQTIVAPEGQRIVGGQEIVDAQGPQSETANRKAHPWPTCDITINGAPGPMVGSMTMVTATRTFTFKARNAGGATFAQRLPAVGVAEFTLIVTSKGETRVFKTRLAVGPHGLHESANWAKGKVIDGGVEEAPPGEALPDGHIDNGGAAVGRLSDGRRVFRVKQGSRWEYRLDSPTGPRLDTKIHGKIFG